MFCNINVILFFYFPYNTFILMGYSANSMFVVQNGIAGKEKELQVVDTQKHTFVLDTVSNIGRVDQTSQVLDTSGIKEVEYNFVLFAQNSHGVVKNNASFRMNYCKITENDSLILNLIPYIDDEGIPCMYDSISKRFFYNNGTGTFNYE